MLQHPELPHPDRFINGIEKSPQFMSELPNRGRTKALGTVAQHLARQMEKKEVRTDTDRLNEFAVQMIGTLPDFIEGRKQLSIIERRQEATHVKVDRREKLPYLRKVIPFNHVVRDLIDSFQGIASGDIVRFTKSAARNLDGSQAMNEIETETRECLVGMQHEIGLEQILWNIDGVEDVLKADEDQELHGIDLIAIYYGEEITLDAKASPVGAQKAIDERDRYMWSRHLTESDMRDRGYPLWSGINFEDFHGGFRVDERTIERCVPGVERALQRLYAVRTTTSTVYEHSL